MEGGELFKTAQMDGRVDSRSRIHRSPHAFNREKQKKA
jgi:hypothetical protein